MSRPTSAQIIALGEYLESDFDPASLTVSQLLGILGYHNVNYPTPYSKPKLITVFNEEIRPRAGKFKKDRIKKENSIASDDGIVDGATGQPLRREPTRRGLRRLSRALIQEDDGEVSGRPDPPKRRRSSAQPTLGGPTRTIVTTETVLAEESEPEELPMKKIGRIKKMSDAAGVQARRVSNTAAEDSGWEDNNIFQSGAESSSPARPSPLRTKPRKSAVLRKSRKSSSAPPQMLVSTPPQSPGLSKFSPPQSGFQPQLNSTTLADQLRFKQPQFTAIPLLAEGHIPLKGVEPKEDDSEDESDIIKDAHLSISETVKMEDMRNRIPKQDILEVSEDNPFPESELPVMRSVTEDSEAYNPSQALVTIIFRLLYALLGVSVLYVAFAYKEESSSIGFCDTGTSSNHVLEDLKAHRLAVEACNRENKTLLHTPPSTASAEPIDMTPCPLPPLIPGAHPVTCTPCPEHAKCTPHSLTCDLGYLLRPHPLLFYIPISSLPQNTKLKLSSSLADLVWKVLSESLDGLPGVGSVAFPPRCVEDPKRKRNIGALGKAVESLLGQERGRRVCVGSKALEGDVKDDSGGEAKRWGVELETLREIMKKKTPPHLRSTFDDTFNEAIQQLIQWGGVIIGEDNENLRYVAHSTPTLTWDCAVTVKSREIWGQWRTTFFGIILVILSLFFGRTHSTQKRIENRRVAGLVQIALDTLRNQELAHHTDPVTATQPYLSSLQLRDLILQDEHSIAARSRLWDRVERIVEGNANVRANLQEIQGGDEMRVWRWVGSAGQGPGIRKLESEDRDL